MKQRAFKVLRWSEKYTKTDMVYLARGAFWANAEQLIQVITGVILSIAFANLVSREVYGQYAYISSIFGLLMISTLSGMESSVTRSVAQGNDGFIYSVVKLKLRWGMLGLFAGVVVGLYYFLKSSETLGYGILIASLFVPLLSYRRVSSSYLYGKKEFRFLSLLNIVMQIVAAAALVSVLFFTDNLFLILLGYYLPLAISALISFLIVIHRFHPNKNIDADALKYGKFLSWTRIFPMVRDNMDKIIVWNFLGPADVAVYAFAMAPVEKVKGVIGNIKTLAMPKMSQIDRDNIKNTLQGKIFRFTLLLIPLVIVYIIFIPFVFRWLYPQYLESIVYSQILILSVLFTPQLLYGAYFTAHKEKIAITINQTILPVIRIVLVFILGYFYGLFGIVFSRIIEQVIGSVFARYFFKRS